MQRIFKLPQIGSFPHDNGGRLGWGKRPSLLNAVVTHEHFLILQLIDEYRTIDNRPHPNLPPSPGEGACLVRMQGYLVLKS